MTLWSLRALVQPAPVAVLAGPQGCTAPGGGRSLLAAFLLQAAYEAVTSRGAHVVTKVYMDDRTLVATTPSGLLHGIATWSGWSAEVGLFESTEKLQAGGPG